MPAYAQATSFRDAVEEALKHFNDPTWLGKHSPLAAPYLLARHLDAKIDAPIARGRVLQDLLKRAAAQLEGKQGKRSRDILEQHYFNELKIDAVWDALNLAKATFYASRTTAIDSLAEILTREIQPALTLETAPLPTGELFGRTTEIAGCLAALQQKQTVQIMGGGGMGKTALGSHLAHTWGARHVCWFTVRPGLTDHLSALLLHLGFFFRQHNAPALWQEMIAAQSRIDPNLVLGLVRFITEQDRPQPLLLCIDEVDLLQTAPHGEAEPLLVFLQGLRGVMPLLLIGQRSTLAADSYVTLGGLSSEVLHLWLLQRRLRLAPEERTRLHHVTGGAPHLIELFVTLHQTGDPLDSLLQQLAAAPTLPALLGRVFQRLSDAERGLLLELAVMQAPAPAAVWQQSKAAGALHLLLERHLVQSDGYGRIWLLPVYRQPIYDSLPAEKLVDLHERAAAIFAAHGQTTIAAYHHVHAGAPERAIRLWSRYQTEEIDQGQAHAARQLFRGVAAQELPAPVAEELRLLLARLEHLAGNTAQAHADLRALVWQTPLLAVEADALSGVIANDEEAYAAARGFLHNGLARAEQLLETRLAQMYKGIAWSYFEERDLAPAWKATHLAAYEVENMRGRLHEAACEYALAESHFLAALALAQDLSHEQGVAKTAANLSGLYALLGRFDEAKAQWNAAYAGYLRLEKTMSVAGCQINLGFLLNLAGEHAAAWTTAEEVEAYLAARSLDAMTPRRLRGVIALVKAEAALGLGELDRAEWCAIHAIEESGDRIAPDATRTLAEVHFRRGDLEEAALLIDRAILLAQAAGDRYLEAYAWRAAAPIQRARRQPDAAAHAAAAGIDLFTTLNLPHEAGRV